MSFNHVQDATDKIVKQLLQQPRDNERQPYEHETIRQFIVAEISELRLQGKSEAEIEGLIRKVDEVFLLNNGEFREYCERLDVTNAQYIKNYNDDIIYREIIKIIIQTKGLIGLAAMQMEKKLLELTPLGFRQTNPNIYLTLEKHVLQNEEIQAKLKLSDSIVKTEDKIKEIEQERNQLVGQGMQLSLKPRK